MYYRWGAHITHKARIIKVNPIYLRQCLRVKSLCALNTFKLAVDSCAFTDGLSRVLLRVHPVLFYHQLISYG